MKKRMRYFSYMLMLTLLVSTMYAQNPVKDQDKSASPKEVSAKKLKAAYHPRKISWWDSGNGFICKYNIESTNYITRFDKQGNYVETLKQEMWNDSSALRPFFQQSEYKLQRVISYWEVSDADKKGYYLEMSDSKNQVSSVWVDELGKFSIIPTVKPR
jgi:hypothetical protein